MSDREWPAWADDVVDPVTGLTLYYSPDCEPISFRQWCELRGHKRVALTEFTDIRISTVYLGMDHSFGFGPPLIYETMVFGGPLSEEMERYSTREQALAGHDIMVARVKHALQKGHQ